jgi:hypothetical protein
VTFIHGVWPWAAWQAGIGPLWAMLCWASHHGSHGLLAGPGRACRSGSCRVGPPGLR